MKDIEYKLFMGIMFCMIIVMFLMMILVAGKLGDGLTSQELGIKKVDCYDKQSNVIIGVQCEEMDYCTYFGWLNGQRCSEVNNG